MHGLKVLHNDLKALECEDNVKGLEHLMSLIDFEALEVKI